jgi:hypothetical protein
MHIANKCKNPRHNARRGAIVIAALLIDRKITAWEVDNRESGDGPPSSSGRRA